MLLVHQAGNVKIGEVVRPEANLQARYTLTYTPSADRILPTPPCLHLKIKNTSAIPLRAAYLHGPYTLHVSAYPSTFNPNRKVQHPHRDGIPQFEPLLKAGGHWTAKLTVPDDIRETGADNGGKNNTLERQTHGSATWIIEVASQILFSNSASVNFELLVGRDERSLELGFAAVAGHGHGAPGQVQEHVKERKKSGAKRANQLKGVYSRAVKLVVEDTEALWDKPPLPQRDDEEGRPRSSRSEKRGLDNNDQPAGKRQKKKVHLVVVTHGLHSNLGADMLYLKESIDATAKQARVDAKKRKEAYRKQVEQKDVETSATEPDKRPEQAKKQEEVSTAPLSGGQEDLEQDEDEEEVIVRGFFGNAVRTERGIQYLGKRLAKHVLQTTYPDQPFLPVKKSMTRSFTDQFATPAAKAARDGPPVHSGSSIHKDNHGADKLAYTFTSISFIGHSLGGLVQTYAIAYIHKHAPHFFEQIKPINFITLASPMLGLSNENPRYIRFALDFGVVGRTGQDLGLTWRPPTIARSGWSAMLGGLGNSAQKEHKQGDPGAKPLLRILPTGPAHYVLRLFRNRTLYSNVVNDGVVPLRTSCLLFLDWRGLGKVEKARRENGLIGTMAEWGWSEITGANTSRQARANSIQSDNGDSAYDTEDGTNTPTRMGEGETVPQPPQGATEEDHDNEEMVANPQSMSHLGGSSGSTKRNSTDERKSSASASTGGNSMLDDLMNFFRPVQEKPQPKKVSKALRRGQTVQKAEEESPPHDNNSSDTMENTTPRPHGRPPATRGDSLLNDPHNVTAPPSTTIFESASDILNPPIPSTSWITDPGSRARTIFHDRVYHPEDIPPPPVSRPARLSRSFSNDRRSLSMSSEHSQGSGDSGGMKVEEKIARAYHRDLSWRKVLVRLEPDAHNNIIVRRMFANAYGWPVVKHLCDTHFADTHAANTRDEDEPATDRAQGMEQTAKPNGEEVRGQHDKELPEVDKNDLREAADELTDLNSSVGGASNLDSRHMLRREGSAVWDDTYFEVTDDDEEDDGRNIVQRLLNSNTKGQGKEKASTHHPSTPSASTEGHRGLGPTSPATSPTSVQSPKTNTAYTGTLTEELRPPSSKQSPGITTEIGLRKSVEEQISPSKIGRARDSTHGVSEQIARLGSTGE
ncbi:hypothetical protein LTR50_000263 [Elasticomyces elasticus]|nr:hypothetical protein LTR50_000263 [Elasticomyces elasticus]